MPASPQLPEQRASLTMRPAAGILSPAAVRTIPYALFIALLAAQPALSTHIDAAGIDSRWLYAARITLVGSLLLVWWRRYSELHTADGLSLRKAAASVAAGVAVFLLWITLDFDWARMGAADPGFDPTLADGSGLSIPLTFFRLLGLAVIVPVMEELFWRSFLLRWIDRQDFLHQSPARASLRAILVCAGLFALEHHLWLAGFAAGVVYVLVYVYGRNLWLAVISHATTNALLGGWIIATRSWHLW